MAGSPPSQRAYRAACPNCGAPVEFRSAASAGAVCSFCRSTLVRDGAALRRIGVVAELFDDHSPLQLGAAGRHQGAAFTLVGRLQYAYPEGTWNEWHALFDTGKSGWLSEDNGAYVFAFDAALDAAAPAPDTLRPGQRAQVAGRAWDVASVQRAHLLAAQGELPAPPRLEGEFVVADLRNAAGEVGTLDYADPARPQWSVGRAVALADLALQGLREAAEKTLGARSVSCPGCGAALEVRLATTRSITCPQCKAVVDLSGGVGADLEHYAQTNSGASGLEPQLALGSTGRLALGTKEPLAWQVVGYLERCTVDDGEQFFWREYLLYRREAGFAFLVDAEDGWSWVRPITGAPEQRGDAARWQGDTFALRERYDAKVTWVQGEFYWRVRRDETARVADYAGRGAASAKRLSREEVEGEVTWSAGETLPAAGVADAFGLAPEARQALAGDARPLAGKRGGLPRVLLLLGALFLVTWLLERCGRDDCDAVRNSFGESSAEYRQCLRTRGSGSGRAGGGSFGGFSSGGGHK